MKTLVAFVCSVLLSAVACFASDAVAAPVTNAAQADSPTVSKLRELVTIRERQAQRQQDLAKAGRASDDPAAAVALAEARIELARELGQQQIVLAQLRKILELRRDWLQYVKSRAVDRLREGDVDEAQAALLQAELRLLREQKRPA
jgi:hypothetical protein